MKMFCVYRRIQRLGILIFSILISLYSDSLYAELSGAALPGSARPDVVAQSLQEQAPTQQQQPMAPLLTPPAQELPPGMTEEMKKIRFQLNGIVLTGNHVYPTIILEKLYQDKLHKNISVVDLFMIIQGITNFYRNNGYILTRAILPPQEVENGIVRIQIVEGYIENINVTGKPNGAKCLVKAFGNKIKACPPLNITRLEKYLLIANEIPGTQVKAVFEASHEKKPTLGGSDLTLVTENKPYFGYVGYDNYGTRYIGPQQMTANLGFNSFITSGDSGQVTVVKTPKWEEINYLDLNYNMALDANGTRLLIGGTKTTTMPQFVLSPLKIQGFNDNYYTMITYPVIRTRTENLTLRTGFNYLDNSSTILDSNLYMDHVRSFDLGGSYNFTDRWQGSNMLSSDFRQGLPILGYSSDYNPDTANTSRPGGRGDYTKFILMASRVQGITSGFSGYGLVQGQWAFNPLLSSEQFAFGGSQLGRGYDIGEMLGDRGLAGTAELRYDLAVGRFKIQSLQMYAFYDWGLVWNFKYIGGTPRKQSGTSTGIGTRFYMTKYISGNVMWTQTLTRQVATEALIHQGRRPRTWFSVVAAFG